MAKNRARLLGIGMVATCSTGWAQGPEPSPLVVRRQPGLDRVLVRYASGDLRELVFDPEEDAFIGLPPPALAGQSARERVEIAKHFDDGTVVTAHAWPRWCDRDLVGFFLYDPVEQLVHVELDPLQPPVRQVTAQLEGSGHVSFLALRDSWHLDATELAQRFDLAIEWADGRWQTWEGTRRGAARCCRCGWRRRDPPAR
jgi:hypothetical protein